jgi:hypothetical protein
LLDAMSGRNSAMRFAYIWRVAPTIFLLCLAGSVQAQGKYTLKEAEAQPPMELKAPIRDLLQTKALQVLDAQSQTYCEIWFRKAIPAKATEAQVKNGLTYQEIEQTTLIGAIRFAQPAKDYRGQEVKPGVYTLRLAYQPQDGDHMGTAPYTEFCLLAAAEHDAKPDLMEPKRLNLLSAKGISANHPAVFLLFPASKGSIKTELTDQGMEHWVLKHALQADVNGKPAPLGIGLTVIGHSAAG